MALKNMSIRDLKDKNDASKKQRDAEKAAKGTSQKG